MSEEMVTITRKEFEEMYDSHRLLECLRAEGVDNWDGWDYAIEMFHEGEEQ